MDREKVIKAYEDFVNGYECFCTSDDYEYEMHKAVLALLKEQEAVEPKVEKAILDYQSWHYICGDCGGQIDIDDNYCRHCGRVVAHLSNRI